MIHTTPLVCPECGSVRVCYGEYVLRLIPFGRRDGDTVYFDMVGDKMIWEGCKDDHLMCRDCCHEWPVPADLKVDFE